MLKRILSGALVVLCLMALLLTIKRPTLSAFPPTTLTFAGPQRNGSVTALILSNGCPTQLLYDPHIEIRDSDGWTPVPDLKVMDRGCILAPGQSHTLYVPGSVSKDSLRLNIVAREKAAGVGLLGPVEKWLDKIQNGRGQAWLGHSYHATLEVE